MMDTVQAVVLGTIRYGDSSLIAACFTKQHGLQSYILKGVLTARRNRKLSKSFFEPLTFIEFQAKKNKENRLGYLQEVGVLHAYTTIPFDLRKKALLFFLAEVIHQVVKEEEQPNLPLFEYLEKTMLWLDQHDTIGLFHLKTMLDLTEYMGFSPNLSNSFGPYFDLETGCLTTSKPKINYIDGQLKELWVEVLGTKFEDMAKVKITKKEKFALIEFAISYFKLHLQQFRPPKSTEILNELFKVS